VLGVQPSGHPLDFDEGGQVLVDADAVVCEVTLDLVLGGQVCVLVVAEAGTQKVGDEEPGVPLVGVTSNQVRERLVEPLDRRLDLFPGVGLPLWCAAGRLRWLSPDPPGR